MKTLLVITIGLAVAISSIALFVFIQNINTPDFNSKLLDLNFTDREYAEATENLLVVKAFLDKYPNATITVQADSSFKLVYYHLSKIKAPTWVESVELTVPVKISDVTPDINNIQIKCSTVAGWSAVSSISPTNSPNDTAIVMQVIKSENCLS